MVMTKWEYKIVEVVYPNASSIYAMEKVLNEWGLQGWELVTTTFGDGGYPKYFHFKRQIMEASV